MTQRSAHSGTLLVAAVGLFLTLLGPDGTAAPPFGDWGAPVNLGPAVNSTALDSTPHVARHGLSLYFSSTRTEGSAGGEDLWVSRRPSTSSPWGAPVNLGPAINTPSIDRSPALSRDGHYLFFASDRAGGFGGLDLWVSWRTHVHNDLGWQAPVNMGSLVNSAATDAGPVFFENDDVGVPQLYVASNRAGGAGGLDIWVSALLGGFFQPPTPVAELNTPNLDLTPGIRFDGLEIVIASTRPGGFGGQDLWVATRNSPGDPWGPPTNLGGTVNSPASEIFPSISGDRLSLYFSSERPGGAGSSDLWVSTRSR